jgi:hypothetical protein
MKRTLISGRLYFGIDALLMQRGAERVITRVTASPTPVVMSVQTIAHDFQVDSAAAVRLAETLVHNGLLTSLAQHGGYGMTERLREYADAQLLAPLDHAAARDLLDRVIETVVDINTRWRSNPIMIARVAVSGRFTEGASKVPELRLWAIVRLRASTSRRLWGRAISKVDGAHEIRKALRGFGPLVTVRMVVDDAAVERPYTMLFDADTGEADGSLKGRLDDLQHRMRRLITTRKTRQSELDRLCGTQVASTRS